MSHPIIGSTFASRVTLGKVGRRFVLWTAICWASALPAFVLAQEEWDVTAMVLVITAFTIIYTFATCTAWFEKLYQRPFIRPSLYVGYGVRLLLLLSAFMAIGAMMAMSNNGPRNGPLQLIAGVLSFTVIPEFFVGMISTSIVAPMVSDPHSFVGTMLTTALHGGILNVIVGITVLIAYGVQRLFRRMPLLAGMCIRCGYDLRASRDACPECGEPIVLPGPGLIPLDDKAVNVNSHNR